MRLPLGELFRFVSAISKKYDIDESHSLGHSMRVFQFAEMIAKDESRFITTIPMKIVEDRPIIQAASILHDTCDKKYRDEKEGLLDIEHFLTPIMPYESVSATLSIIEHMSYSKIIKDGMPNLGRYQTAFNIVREADLLDAYDFDRSMIYHMQRNGKNVEDAYNDARDLFENRVLKHNEHGLLLTRYARCKHVQLSQTAVKRMYHWQRSLK